MARAAANTVALKDGSVPAVGSGTASDRRAAAWTARAFPAPRVGVQAAITSGLASARTQYASRESPTQSAPPPRGRRDGACVPRPARRDPGRDHERDRQCEHPVLLEVEPNVEPTLAPPGE